MRPMKLVFVASTLLFACDSGGPADQLDETPIDNGSQIETPPVETPPVETPPVETPPVVETPTEQPSEPSEPTIAYPEGPYGTGYLDVIEDLEFFDPWTGAKPRLSDFYQDPDVSVLLISSAAGWCTACMYEAWDLVDVYEKYHERGLEVFYTLYEDRNADPIFQDGDSDDAITADLAFFKGWKENLGKAIGYPVREANYPTMVDRDFVLEPYYNQGATPLTLIVRTSDMRILYREVGYAAGTVEQMVRGHVD